MARIIKKKVKGQIEKITNFEKSKPIETNHDKIVKESKEDMSSSFSKDVILSEINP